MAKPSLPLPMPALTALVALGPLGCVASDAPTSGAYDVEAVPRLVLEEELRIGSVEDPDYGFSRIGAVVVDEDGSVYVFESLDREVRVYSATGELLRRIGRSGAGPGEFQGSIRMGLAGDTLWTSDGRRVTLFDRRGVVLSSARLQEVRVPLHSEGATTSLVPIGLGSDGLLASGRGPTSVGSGTGTPLDTVYIPRVRFDLLGQVVDTAGVYPVPRSDVAPHIVDVGRSRFPVPPPPTVLPRRILTADGSFVIDALEDDAFTVARLNLRGDTLRMRNYRYGPVPYPEMVLDEAVSRSLRFDGNAASRLLMPTQAGPITLYQYASDSVEGRRAVRAEMKWPPFQSPVQDHRLGDDGALWLQREETGADSRRWLILGADLEPAGELELPGRMRIVWSSGDHAWGVETDDLDIPWLVRFRLRERVE